MIRARRIVRRALASALLGCALTGCLEGKKISDIDAPAAAIATAIPSGPIWIVPPGVFVAPSRRGAALVDGLYPTTDPSERCCWLATNARIALAAPATATHADLTVLIPQYPFFDARPQALDLRVGTLVRHVPDLTPGVHRIALDLPRDAARVTLEIRSANAFVPAHEGVNTDTRALGLVLLAIAYR